MPSTAFFRIALHWMMAECGLENEHQKQESMRNREQSIQVLKTKMQTQTDWFQIFKWGSDMNIDERVTVKNVEIYPR